MSGADELGYPFSFLKEVTVVSGEKKTVCVKEPFVATVPHPSQVGGAKKEGGVCIEVVFHAHYGEPPMTLPVNVDSEYTVRCATYSMSCSEVCLQSHWRWWTSHTTLS